MPEISVARRYAQAMIELAGSAELVDRIGADLQTFTALLDDHDGLLRRALYNPVFTAEERQQVIDELLPKLDLHSLTINLLRLVNEKGRLSAIGDIASVFGELADERAGRVRVHVTTAEPLTPQLEAEIKAALEGATGQTVILDPHVDPSLIGGMIARVGGKVYDSSIRTRLEQLKQALIDSQIPAVA